MGIGVCKKCNRKCGIGMIAVLDYNNAKIDIINVDEYDLSSYESVDSYLEKHCGYNLDEISWMQDVSGVNFLHDYDFVENEDK